jgi:hypothetical protein
VFGLLVADRGDLAPELVHVRRFRSEWGKAASVELRLGGASAIDEYETHGRVPGDEGVLYVAATRGRESNRFTLTPPATPIRRPPTTGPACCRAVRSVLAAVLANEGADVSAHETMRRAQHQSEDFTALAGEYQTLARVAQAERWDALLERCGLSQEQLEQVRASEAHGPLLAALRDAEARGLDVDKAVPGAGRSPVPRRRGGPRAGPARPSGPLGGRRRSPRRE